jgi:hypothetical protein
MSTGIWCLLCIVVIAICTECVVEVSLDQILSRSSPRPLNGTEQWSHVFPWNSRRDHHIDSMTMNSKTGLICTHHRRYGQSLWFFLPGSLLVPQNPIYQARDSVYVWTVDHDHHTLYVYHKSLRSLERHLREWNTYRWISTGSISYPTLERLIVSPAQDMYVQENAWKWMKLSSNLQTKQPVVFGHARRHQTLIVSDSMGLDHCIGVSELAVDIYERQRLVQTFRLEKRAHGTVESDCFVHHPNTGWWRAEPGQVQQLVTGASLYPPRGSSDGFGASIHLHYPWLWVESTCQWHLYTWSERLNRFIWRTSVHLPIFDRELRWKAATNCLGDLLLAGKHRVYFWKNAIYA